jgi:hypothetical protein
MPFPQKGGKFEKKKDLLSTQHNHPELFKWYDATSLLRKVSHRLLIQTPNLVMQHVPRLEANI